MVRPFSYLVQVWSLVLLLSLPLTSIAADPGVYRIQVFENGEHKNGRSIELSNLDCTSNSLLRLHKLIISKLGDEAVDKYIEATIHGSDGYSLRDCSRLYQRRWDSNRLDGNTGDGNDFDIEDELNRVYIVPKGRLFVWPTFEIGRRQVVDRLLTGSSLYKQEYEDGRTKPIILETLSDSPRLFRLFNFFSREEAEFLINFAPTIEEEDYKLKRSSTGSVGYNINPTRTSDNAFDTNSHISRAVKHRAFELLGIEPYNEEFADGLQVLRYNQSAAYVSHMDYIVGGDEHDYDSAADGTNRFATVILYLSDVEDGGETVFPQARIPDGIQDITKAQAREEASRYLESHGIADNFPEGSWQRDMVADCRSRLAVKPKIAEAILFYSQNPDGSPDPISIHGGCPVLKGIKWAANVWIWNGPRNGHMIRDVNTGKMRRKTPEERQVEQDRQWAEESARAAREDDTKRNAEFRSVDVPDAAIFWQDQFWANMVIGAPNIAVNTFVGHVWTIRVKNEVVLQWTISEDRNRQIFSLRKTDLPAGFM